MTAPKYKKERQKRGTQIEVAKALGVSNVTICRRESGKQEITKETWLALMALPEKNQKV